MVTTGVGGDGGRAAALAAGYALVDEGHQMVAPGQVASVRDAVLDTSHCRHGSAAVVVHGPQRKFFFSTTCFTVDQQNLKRLVDPVREAPAFLVFDANLHSISDRLSMQGPLTLGGVSREEAGHRNRCQLKLSCSFAEALGWTCPSVLRLVTVVFLLSLHRE